LEKTEAKQRVEEVVQQMADGLGINYHWNGDRLIFGRLGVNGHIDVDNNEINVEVRKSPFIPVSDATIRNQIESYLNEYFQ